MISAWWGTIVTPTLIITAGAWTQRLAALAGIQLPVDKLPMILDRQHDLSFRHDTETPDHVLMTRTIRNEPVGFNFDWDAAAFDAVLAPRLRHYLPSCGEPQLQRGWAGHYAVTPDENPILGQHPEYARLFMAVGFSGHGVMLTPATGKALSELIGAGHCETFDLHPYRLAAFCLGRPHPRPADLRGESSMQGQDGHAAIRASMRPAIV